MMPAYPLQWPEGFPRAARHEAGRFKTSLSAALKNAEASLRLFGTDSGRPVTNVVMSSNYTLGVTSVADPGIALWFIWDGEQRCIAVDRYSRPEANLQAIHHVLEARRTELRHGTLALIRATMKGFSLALPAPGGAWWDVLGLKPTATVAEIDAAYQRLAKQRHPDAGGTNEAMAELNRARTAARKERA